MLPRTLVFLVVSAAIGYWLGRSRGMPLQGLFLGLAFGPLGWALILLWPASWIQPMGKARSGPNPDPGPQSRPKGEGGRACPRCAHPAAPEAGSCPNCGNVLVPVTYRVG